MQRLFHGSADDVDDAPVARFAHARQKSLGEQVVADQMLFKSVPEGLWVCRRQGAPRGSAGVVHQAVDGFLRCGFGGFLRHLFRTGVIDGHRPVSCAGQGGQGLGEPFRVPGDEVDAGPEGGEVLRGCQADALRSAAHPSGFSGQVEGHPRSILEEGRGRSVHGANLAQSERVIFAS